MIEKLSDVDLGQVVIYTPAFGKEERGRIKSFDNERKIAFVVYSPDNLSWVSQTGQGTPYANLRWESLDEEPT